MNGQTRGSGTGRVAGLVAVVWLCLVASAWSDDDEDCRRPQISVTGEGSVSVRPDVAQANLGLRVTGATVGEAMGESRQHMARVLDALRQSGVAEKDVITSQFSIHRERQVPAPRRDGGAEMEEEPQYVVTNMVRVTIRDLDRADLVLDRAIDAGANEVHGIRFALEDEEEAAAGARELAVAQARAKAAQLAQLHGAQLGPPIRIAEMSGGGGPRPMMSRAMASAESATVTVGELTFSARVEVVYEIEVD
ncbi:SIMPL domain-containing protein [Candidatus Latescibacterota bacterium]